MGDKFRQNLVEMLGSFYLKAFSASKPSLFRPVRYFGKVTFPLPSIADSISEATVKSFEKNIGDWADVDEVVMVFETAKNDASVRTTEAGIITEFLVAEGDDVDVGANIFVLDTDGKKSETAAPKQEAPKEENKATETKSEEAPAQKAEPAEPAKPAPDMKSPPKAPAPKTPAGPPSTGAPGRTERREKMSRMRKTVAANLKGSQNTNASVTTFQELDMGEIMTLRKELGEEFLKRNGLKLGFMSFFLKACAIGLMERPVVNAVIDNEKNEVVYKDYVDISVAMSAPKGLVTPIIRNVQSMSFAEIEQAMIDLANKARTNNLAIEDQIGGTFTLSNGGVFGSMNSAPIINPGMTAIMGMHNIVNRPVVRNGQIVSRPVMYVSMTYDHRLCDGREGAGYLKRVSDMISDPRKMLLEL